MDEYVSKLENIKVLSDTNNYKSFIGDIADDKAIFICIHKGNANSNFLQSLCNSNKITENNRFKRYESQLNETMYDITIIYPALKEDIQKYTLTEKRRVSESYNDYITHVYPQVIKQDLTWVQNIFNGISEQENIMYKDDTFTLIPDMKWDRKNMKDLHCLAIARDSNLRSIRSLTAEHLPLLTLLYENTIREIKAKYNVDENQLRVYFHYPPSFWHLHIHFDLISSSSKNALSEFAHPFFTVLRNIELVTNYYQRITIDVLDKYHNIMRK